MCGPSNQEQGIAASDAIFAKTLNSNYNTNYGKQSAIMDSLKMSLDPIISAGSSQQGMSAAQLAAKNTQALDSVGSNYANAARAVGNQLAGRGGGGEGLQSGVDAQIKEGLASSAAGTLSNEQEAITNQNYDIGRQNYFGALSGEHALAGLYDPNGTASQAGHANDSAFQQADQISNEENQKEASIAAGITSLVGGAATFGLGGIAGVAGSAAGASQPGAFLSGGMNALSGRG